MTTSREAAVAVRNLSKKFRLYESPADMLIELSTRRKRHSEFWALRDLTFTLARGRAVGIMGRNGAGKSTLLKILAGTMDATEGEVIVNGRVAAMLELGSGFHPDYTGMENIIMGGMCLGMSKKEVTAKREAIIDFSELRDFIHQPFRTYSTGMQSRLAFATAVAVDAEIIIIDEALSVGDMRFQAKCFKLLKEFQTQGKTILFVSHDVNAFSSLCDEGLLLDRGKLLQQNEPALVTQQYYDLMYGNSLDEKDFCSSRAEVAPGEEETAYSRSKGLTLVSDILAKAAQATRRVGDGSSRLLACGLVDDKGNACTKLLPGKRYTFVLHVRFSEALEHACFGFAIRNSRGQEVFGCTSRGHHQLYPIEQLDALHEFRLDLTMHLANGPYYISFGIARDEVSFSDFVYDAYEVEVRSDSTITTASIANLYPAFHPPTCLEE